MIVPTIHDRSNCPSFITVPTVHHRSERQCERTLRLDQSWTAGNGNVPKTYEALYKEVIFIVFFSFKSICEINENEELKNIFDLNTK